MQRMKCPDCGKEYDVMAGCNSCLPAPGPFRCPACGAVLVSSQFVYYHSPDMLDED